MSTTLVLGAGASLANALHFRAQRMPETRPPLDGTFFATVRSRGIPLTPALRNYLEDVVQVDPDGDQLATLRMEEVFKDVFFDFQDAPGRATFLDAYIDLVDLYLRVLRETTNWLNADTRTGAPVGRLMADAAAVDDDLSIVTFNHDLVIENEIERRASLRRRWCIDETYGAIADEMSAILYPESGAASFHRHAEGECDHERLIRIFKLHGSLNWMVRLQGDRPTARFLSGQTERPMVLLARRRITVNQRERRVGRGRTVWRLWPVVVPPVYAKQALRATLHAAWDDARAALSASDRVVFFGYSLPAIDIEAEKLFQRALAANAAVRWVDVVNPDPAAAARYAAVTRVPVRWYPRLSAFLESGGLAQ